MLLNGKYLSIPFLILLFISVSCKKVYRPPNCDPGNKFKANFKTGYKFLNDRFAESDTIINFSVFFEADSTYNAYEWQIGSKIYNTKNVRLVFPASALGQKIPVRLIATSERNTCDLNDMGIDTVDKELMVFYAKELNDINDYAYEEKYLTGLPFFGKWHGYFEDTPTDTFTVTINNNGKAPASITDRFYRFRIYNLPKGCSVKQENGVASCTPIDDVIQKYYGYMLEEVSYNAFYVSESSFLCCPRVEMFGKVDAKTNTITIECNIYSDSNNTIIKRLFVGKKQKL